MPALDDPRALAELELFQELTGDELTFVNGLLRRKAFSAGTLLMSADQPGELIYLILDGSVKVFLSREDGTEVNLSILGAGQTVGEMSLLDRAGRSANAVTLEPSTLLWMDRASFYQALRTIPTLGYNLLRLLSRRLRLANEQILALSSLDVTGRVAWQILALAEEYGRREEGGGVHIPLRLTQGDIASLVGTSREQVNRAMVRFKTAGHLSVDSGYHITVHHRRALADYCR